AIDEDGQPFVHRELRFRFGYGDSEEWLDATADAASSAIVHTGANGGFLVRLRDAELEAIEHQDEHHPDPTRLLEIRAGYRREHDHLPVQAVVVRPIVLLGRASDA